MKKIFYFLLFFVVINSQAYVITHSPIKDDLLTLKEVLKTDNFQGECEKEIFDKFLMFNPRLDLSKDKIIFNNYLNELNIFMTYKELKGKRDLLISSLDNKDLSNNLRIVFQGPTMPYFDIFLYSKFCYEQKEDLLKSIKILVSIFVIFLGLLFFLLIRKR